MARLIYSYLASLDGFISDDKGNFDWAVPDDEVHTFINDLSRPIGTYLVGRAMYETMRVWDSPESFPDPSPTALDFARTWQAAEKVVYSTKLPAVSTPRTRIERRFDPAAVRQLKASAERDLAIGGANLAAQALAAGLVDELQLFLAPVLVGGGKRLFPSGLHLALELVEQRRFANGMVYLRHTVTP